MDAKNIHVDNKNADNVRNLAVNNLKIVFTHQQQFLMSKDVK